MVSGFAWRDGKRRKISVTMDAFRDEIWNEGYPLNCDICCYYCHVTEWLQTGFGLVIGLNKHLQIVTTSNYSAIANSHILQFTTARTKSSQSAVSSSIVAW
jgi:hypothetical protein